MSEKRKIGLLGGDLRQLVTGACLAADHECALWGFSAVYGTPEEQYLKDTVRCADPWSAVKCSDAVILPLPVTRDTGDVGQLTLHAPLAGDADPVRLCSLCDRLEPGAQLLGGMIPPLLKRYAAERGIAVVDYYDSEELQIRNAVPTAEGAIAACIDALPITIAGMRAAVFGYGRVGRTLAGRLRALGATVYAVARSTKDRAWAACDGCVPLPLDAYRAHPVPVDALFNTVPHEIFDAALVETLPMGCVYFELASGSGIDRTAARERGIRVIPLPSLPGKTAPVTAGGLICRVIRDALQIREEGRTSG